MKRRCKKIELSERYYLSTSDFDVIYKHDNLILNSPTGSGKSTALLKFVKNIKGKYTNNTRCCNFIIVPTISIAKQLEEKDLEKDLIVIYGAVGRGTVKRRLIGALSGEYGNNINVVLTLETFTKNIDLFEGIGNDKVIYRYFIDESHKIIKNKTNSISLVKKIKNGTLKNVTMITATSNLLEKCFPSIPVIRLEPKRLTKTTIDIISGAVTRKNLLQIITDKQAEHKKVIVHLQNKSRAKELKEELGLKTLLYNADIKELEVIKERVNKADWDVIICTSSLTEGVSLRDKFYSLFVCTMNDTVDNIHQFLSRNRNKESNGGIFKKFYKQFGSSEMPRLEKHENHERNTSFIDDETELLNNYKKYLSYASIEELKGALDKEYIYNSVINLDDEQEQEQKKSGTLSRAEMLERWQLGEYVHNFERLKEGKFFNVIQQGVNQSLKDRLEQDIFNRLNIYYKFRCKQISEGVRQYRKYLIDDCMEHLEPFTKQFKEHKRADVTSNTKEFLEINLDDYLKIEFEGTKALKSIVLEQLEKNKVTSFSSSEWKEIIKTYGYEIEQKKIMGKRLYCVKKLVK